MDLTSSTRAIAFTAGAGMLGGLAMIVHGLIRNDVTRSVAGACLTIVSLTVIALALIRRWIVDTSEERRILAAAQRVASAERTRYIASQAALANEMGRRNQDLAAERASNAARLKAEREALRAEFEAKRGDLIAETMEATVLMMQHDKLTPGKTTTGTLIQFPHQMAQRQTEQARSREHGVLGP
ncbi:hypothetical protein [Streptomyces spinosirectus]